MVFSLCCDKVEAAAVNDDTCQVDDGLDSGSSGSIVMESVS